MHSGKSNKQDDTPLAGEFSELILASLLSGRTVGIMVIGLDLVIRFCNESYRTMLGYSEEELAGKCVTSHMPAEERPQVAERLRNLISGKRPDYQTERQHLRKNGEKFWARGIVKLVRNPQTNEPLAIVVQLLNIDAQKKAEDALCETESRWSHALEAAGQGVWDYQAKNDSVWYSNVWRQIRGIPDDEAVDDSRESWLSRVHPADREWVLENVDSQQRGEDGFSVLEYRERHRDGHYVWIRSRGRPVEWDEAGEPVRTIGTDMDITAFKAVQAELAEGKERLRVTLNSIGDGVISTDKTGAVTFMNPAAENMTGWREEDAIGLPAHQIFRIEAEDDRGSAPDPVSAVLDRNEPTKRQENLILTSKTGELRDISERAAPVSTDDGEVIGAVLVFRDITESRNLQRELAYSATHDNLTGLANRSAFETRLADAVLQAQTENREHALCFIDLDGFKAVNDTSGHPAGDALLVQVAQIIRQCCRQKDFVARFGGDEFTLLLPDCSMLAAERVADVIVDKIAKIQFAWDDRVHRIGASIGITSITHTPSTLSGPIAEADAACYSAKANGRGRAVVFDGLEEAIKSA